jgi:hypothetical protein
VSQITPIYLDERIPEGYAMSVVMARENIAFC